MKKLILATTISVFCISLVACTNSGMSNNGQQNNTESSTQNSSKSGTQNNNINNTGDISLEKAKEIALSHAGLSSDQVTFVQANKDFDDGIEKYDIEFNCNGKEYDYEINASNGQIIKYDYDNEYNNTPNNNTTNNQSNINTTADISLEKAKEIALSHAGLSSDQVTFVQANKDFDDGIEKYDIEFNCNGKEYDYEINASNGQIIKYDYDNEYNNTPNNNKTNNQSNINTTANISTEKAKEIALSHAGLSSNQVTFEKTELDFDNGIEKYEVEFYYNNREYSYDIDANNGNVLSYKED